MKELRTMRTIARVCESTRQGFRYAMPGNTVPAFLAELDAVIELTEAAIAVKEWQESRVNGQYELWITEREHREIRYQDALDEIRRLWDTDR